MDKLYTCKEVAERYKVKIDTVWDQIRKGKLKAFKLTPKVYRVSESQLIEFEVELPPIKLADILRRK